VGLPLGPYVNVVVSGGTVHLWGLAESETERRALEAAAHSIPGVRAVENHVALGRIIGAV
jgi:osmotically-inducible protein OsmY